MTKERSQRLARTSYLFVRIEVLDPRLIIEGNCWMTHSKVRVERLIVYLMTVLLGCGHETPTAPPPVTPPRDTMAPVTRLESHQVRSNTPIVLHGVASDEIGVEDIKAR